MNKTFRAAIVGLSAISLSTFAARAHAASLVQNGDFTQFSSGGIGQVGNTLAATGTKGVQGVATGWTVGSNSSSGNAVLDFILNPTTADSNIYLANGTLGSAYGGFAISGPNSGYSNGYKGLPTGATGNILAVDADTAYGASISQLLTNLSVGSQYSISFWDAATEQSNTTAPTPPGVTSQWTVSLIDQINNQTQSHTATAFAIPSNGFSGWVQESLTFTATADREVLRFVASGTPGGAPPVALLSGVSANQVPEPLEFAGTIAGFGLCLALRSKLANKKSATAK